MNERARSIVLTVTLWVVPQAVALCLSAGQTPFTAGFVQPAERAALAVMLAVQLSLSALAFPLLMRTVATSAVVMLLAWAYLLLAGFLATSAPWALAWTLVQVSAWLVMLAAWTRVLRRARAQAIGCALAAFWTLGCVLLAYLRSEYRPGTDTSWMEHSVLLASLRQSVRATLLPLPLLIHAALGLLAMGCIVRRKPSGRS